MEDKYIGPTATLAAAVLAASQASRTELTAEGIAGAFEEAYVGLMAGLARVQKEESLGRLTTWTKLGE